MKRLLAVLMTLALFSNYSQAQYKEYDDKGPSSYKSSGNLLFGFINPKNFSMHHSFNVSMMTTSYGNVSLTSYINSMNYRISDRLNVSADVKFQYSPFASSTLGPAHSTALQNSLSGISLSRASLDYKISDNSFLTIQYRRIDEGDYFNNGFYNSGYYGNYYNPFYPYSR